MKDESTLSVYVPPELREFVDVMRRQHKTSTGKTLPCSLSKQIVIMLLATQDKWLEEHDVDEYERMLEDMETDKIELEIMNEKMNKSRKRSL